MKTYLCIDLKTFFASVECAERGLDPFTTNLVVADPERTEKTICLAITPAMKALGIRNRCRVFEIPPGIEYIMAKPRMRLYMQKSVQIYRIYLRYIAPEDMHVYSIDEVFIDATPYLGLYGLTARQLANMLRDTVFAETGITATAGIGPNLFQAKVALDVTAKHAADGIGVLDDESFREQIQPHRPITDIWGIGPGISRRLAKYGVHDLRGVTELREETLYREFGVNAEFLIDHAYGQEPCTMADIHAFVPESNSLSNGQVLSCDYSFDEGLVILHEMVEALVLELVDRELVAQSISLMVGYAKDSSATREGRSYGGNVGGGGVEGGFSDSLAHDDLDEPARAPFIGEHGVQGVNKWGCGYTGGTRKLHWRTNSRRKLLGAFDDLWMETTRRDSAIRRLNIGFGGVLPEEMATFDLFDDMAAESQERDLQKAVIAVKEKFGKNALLKGVSLTEKATARQRNMSVGGHHG